MTQLEMRRGSLLNLPPLTHGPNVIIKEAWEEDAEAIGTILGAAFPEMEWSEEKVKEELTFHPEVMATFLVLEDGVPAATASARITKDYPGLGYVHWVGAHPAFQGRGFGRLASLAVLHQFVREGCQGAILHTDDPRLAALKVYFQLGFEPHDPSGEAAERWTLVKAQLGI